MKKNVIIIFIILLFLIVAIGTFLLINREITIGDSAIKEIFSFENVEDIDIIFIDILGNEQESIKDIDEKNSFLNAIKDEKIKPTVVDDDKVLGNSYRLLIKYNDKEYRMIISNDSITIKKKVYKTENNLYQKLSTIFTKE